MQDFPRITVMKYLTCIYSLSFWKGVLIRCNAIILAFIFNDGDRGKAFPDLLFKKAFFPSEEEWRVSWHCRF